MKKFFALVFCAVLTLFSGVMLASCDNSKYYISFSFVEPDFVTAFVEVDGNNVQPNGTNRFETRANSKVRVKLYAKQYGVDMSNIVVKANGEERKVWQYNTSFDSLHAGGDLYYGYILFSGMTNNVTISVSGAESYKNTFTFEGADLEDEVSANRLKNTEIKLPGSEDFVDFFEFLSGDDTSFKVDIIGQDEDARSFQIKFKKGINPYEINEIRPFQIEYEKEDENGTKETVTKEFERASYSTGIYTFKVGDIGNNINAKILTDFKNLQTRNFALSLPKDNMTFETEFKLDEATPAPTPATSAFAVTQNTTFNFESSAKVTIKKVLPEADFTNVEAYVNDLKLERDEEAQNEDGAVTFIIPKEITPESTGGENSYNIHFEKISYGEKKTIALKVSTKENHPNKLIAPDFSSVGESGDRGAVAGYDDEGNQLAFENMKMSLDWKYPVLEGRYTTPFDLYDYNVKKGGKTLFNVLEVLNQQKEESGDISGQNLEIAIDGGYVLKAIYNASTQKHDEFHLEFTPEEDVEFSFEDFKLLSKKVNVSFYIQDERVDAVDFAIGTASAQVSGLEWSDPLTRGQSVQAEMKYGDVLYFRLKGDVAALGDGSEFTLEYTIANDNRTLKSTTFRENNETYLVLKFPLSDFYFDTTENMKLVLASSLGPR